jgi:hypothetical protein
VTGPGLSNDGSWPNIPRDPTQKIPSDPNYVIPMVSKDSFPVLRHSRVGCALPALRHSVGVSSFSWIWKAKISSFGAKYGESQAFAM